MSLGRPRVLRQLWLLVAFTVLWLSAGTAPAQSAPRDTIVLMASEIERPAPRDQAVVKAAQVGHKPSRASKWPARRVEPNYATRPGVFVRDRYLHHCALLL